MSKEVIILAGQTLADIAVRENGSVASMFDIAALNGIGVSDELKAGSTLLVPDTIMDKTVAEFFRVRGFYPANGWSITEQQAAETLSGIGYWNIEIDFVVS